MSLLPRVVMVMAFVVTVYVVSLGIVMSHIFVSHTVLLSVVSYITIYRDRFNIPKF